MHICMSKVVLCTQHVPCLGALKSAHSRETLCNVGTPSGAMDAVNAVWGLPGS